MYREAPLPASSQADLRLGEEEKLLLERFLRYLGKRLEEEWPSASHVEAYSAVSAALDGSLEYVDAMWRRRALTERQLRRLIETAGAMERQGLLL